MTKDDILKIAQKAGGQFDGRNWKFACHFYDEQLERFASLIAAKAAAEENEACALICADVYDRQTAVRIIRARHNTQKEKSE